MPTDLTRFLTHAREMTTAIHRPDCPRVASGPLQEGSRTRPRCPGCVTDADRALWVRLADEGDRYLGLTP